MNRSYKKDRDFGHTIANTDWCKSMPSKVWSLRHEFKCIIRFPINIMLCNISSNNIQKHYTIIDRQIISVRRDEKGKNSEEDKWTSTQNSTEDIPKHHGFINITLISTSTMKFSAEGLFRKLTVLISVTCIRLKGILL